MAIFSPYLPAALLAGKIPLLTFGICNFQGHPIEKREKWRKFGRLPGTGKA
jgi:hypothetical protein